MGRHEAGPLEGLEVLRDLRLTQPQLRRDLADRARRGAKQLDDPQPVGFRQGSEQRCVHRIKDARRHIFSPENVSSNPLASKETIP